MIDRLKKQITSGGINFRTLTAAVVFGAIILVFVLFGFQGDHTAVGIGAAARVNETLIPVADFQNEMNRLEQFYGQMFGGAGGMGAQRQFLQQQAMDTLVNSELLAQAAKKEGVLATDPEVRDYILKEMTVFQRDGKFQKDLYEQILAANRMTPAEFENKIRKDIHRMKSQRVFEIVSKPTALEIEKLKALKESKLNISFVKLDLNKAKTVYPVSLSEVNEKLKDETFAKKIEEEFSKEKGKLNQDEQVQAQHILIKTKQGDAESEKAALVKINDIKKRATSEDFGKLATQFSEDAGSAKSKGDLGFFSRGRMVPEFEAAAFSQSVGAVGEPVKTAFGYHLIKVNNKKEAQEAKLEDHKVEMAKRVLANELIQSEMKNLEEALKNSELAKVDEITKKMGFQWEETGYFEMGADFIPKLDSPEVVKAALEVSAQKPLLPRLVHERDTKWVIKYKDSKKEAAPEEQNLVTQISKERTMEMISSWLEGVKKNSSIEINPQVMTQ